MDSGITSWARGPKILKPFFISLSLNKEEEKEDEEEDEEENDDDEEEDKDETDDKEEDDEEEGEEEEKEGEEQIMLLMVAAMFCLPCPRAEHDSDQQVIYLFNQNPRILELAPLKLFQVGLKRKIDK